MFLTVVFLTVAAHFSAFKIEKMKIMMNLGQIFSSTGKLLQSADNCVAGLLGARWS